MMNVSQNMKPRYRLWACPVAVGIVPILAPAFAFTGEDLAKHAKVSMAQARVIALKVHPGTIIDEELERERGGSGLRYSFDVKSGGVTREIGVDAQTGRVLENKREGMNPD